MAVASRRGGPARGTCPATAATLAGALGATVPAPGLDIPRAGTRGRIGPGRGGCRVGRRDRLRRLPLDHQSLGRPVQERPPGGGRVAAGIRGAGPRPLDPCLVSPKSRDPRGGCFRRLRARGRTLPGVAAGRRRTRGRRETTTRCPRVPRALSGLIAQYAAAACRQQRERSSLLEGTQEAGLRSRACAEAERDQRSAPLRQAARPLAGRS